MYAQLFVGNGPQQETFLVKQSYTITNFKPGALMPYLSLALAHL